MRHDHVCAAHTVRVLCICSLVSAITVEPEVNMDMFTMASGIYWHTVVHDLDSCDRRSLHSRLSTDRH